MTQTADYLIIGGGLYGCSIAYQLALQGAKNVVLLERNEICQAATSKSCAIVRTHYSVEANLIHAVESLKVFEDFDEQVGGDIGFQRTGYLILGPEDHREPMLEVFKLQNEQGIDTRVIDAEEAKALHPLLQLDDVEVIGYDTRTGYCDPYLATTAFAKRARDLGVEIRTGVQVQDLAADGIVKSVTTDSETFETPHLILASGGWTANLASTLGVEVPLELSRHNVITLRTTDDYLRTWPIIKDLTTEDKIYFRPDSGGVVLIGTGDHGDPIENPDLLTDDVDSDHIERIGSLMKNRMPVFADADYVNGWTGPYDITPDWNPIVGKVPGPEGVFIAVGFSGHGFKLAPTMGESLASLVLGKTPRLAIDMYSISRFQEGSPLHGAYGIGSIS